jgi:hypothetical protein
MTTKTEFIADLEGRLSSAKVTGFWTDALKLLWLNEAGRQVTSAYRWKFRELALITQTRDSQEHYDYPPEPNEFAKDSIYQLNIDGEDYGAMDGRTRATWAEFQSRKNIGNDTELVFANHNGFYFLYPIPADGLEMSVYGLKNWKDLVNAGDEAITPTELDDAIVKLTLAKCFRKAKKYDEAKAEMLEVLDPQVGLLALAWNAEHQESAGGYMGEAQSSRW